MNLYAKTRLMIVAAAALAVVAPVHAQEQQAAVQAPEECAPVVSQGNGLFVGVVSDQLFANPDPLYRRCSLNEHADAGVRIIRQGLLWKDIEVRRGTYDWSHWDAYVADVARHGIQLMPIIYDAPRWRQQRGRRPPWGTVPPKRAAMKRFSSMLVRRYGPKGKLWRKNPELPAVPIRVWQIWNEPNLARYWGQRPDAEAYVRLLVAAHDAIKRRDRGATVVAAGMPDSELWRAIPLREYIARMYLAGAKGKFDAIAVNAYAGSPRDMLRNLRGVRAIMDAFRDRAGIWITEMGWGTGGPKYRFRTTKAKQATLLAKALRKLARARWELRLRGFVHYMWQDAPPYGTTRDFWGLHTGLFDITGREKPAYRIFRKISRRLRWIR